MSRLAKKPIVIPEKTEVKLEGDTVKVKGPMGELSRTFPHVVEVKQEGNDLWVSLRNEHRDYKALPGTAVAHIKNMLTGVTKGFEKKLIIEGVGYKADVKGTDLHMALGYSHPVIMPIPTGLKVVTEKGSMTISSIDKEALGAFAAKVRSWREPEPYKGKGIRYSDEVIRRKQGKKSA